MPSFDLRFKSFPLSNYLLYNVNFLLYTLKKILVNKLKFDAATIKLSIIDKKWKISVLQLIDKPIVGYQQSRIVRLLIICNFRNFNFSFTAINFRQKNIIFCINFKVR
jgi:hypothetical protein